MKTVMRSFWASAVAMLLLFAQQGGAQESRGSVTGQVVDSSGGVLVGATVTVVNVGTGSTQTVTTSGSGVYTVLFLNPGTYTVTAELGGFRKTRNDAVTVRVGERTQIDFILEPAGGSEDVEVVASPPVLESGSATTGQVLDSKMINEIPLGDGTAYSLTRLVPGATFERAYALQRPMDNDNLRGVTVSGTISSEFTLDGSSNIGSQARVAIQPPADVIQEFKVETAVYDAQVGHTGAGAVNLALKSGTNELHGTVSYYNRSDSRSAGQFSVNSSAACTDTDPATVCGTPRDYNRFTGTLAGPLMKNKTFFTLSYEKLQDDTTESVTGTVPTLKMRNGDFSELLNQTNPVLIYDPLTAQNVNGIITRQPFPGNIIPPNRINPVARNVLNFYPEPNRPANSDQTSNYFQQQPWTYSYYFAMGKIDHEWNSSNRTYLRFIRNFRREERYNWAGEQNGVEISRGGTDRYNWNGAIGHTAILNSSTILDLKASFLRFNDDQTPSESSQTIDLASLGFSGDTVPLFRGYSHIPMFNLDGNAACPAFPNAGNPVFCLGGNQNGFNSGRFQPFYNIQIAPTLTKTTGNHTIKLGYDWRSLRQNEVNEGWRGGQYRFDSQYTRQASNSTGRYGQGVAAFVLGFPTNDSFIETRADYATEVVSHGFFIHDDWRVSSKLTLNLGVRYDLENGLAESQNRNIRGLDLTAASPIQAQAQANFAASVPADVGVNAADFGARVVGGYQYLSADNPNAWEADKNNVQPRFGFTYELTPKTVLRGGVGLYIAPFQVTGVPGIANPINQLGFSRNTPVVTSTDNGLTFSPGFQDGTLDRPVPSVTLLEPVGNAQGLRTNLGGNVGVFVPTERENPEIMRFTFGIQRELPGNFMIEFSYLGQRGKNIPFTRPLNFVPENYRTTNPLRDAAAETRLSQTVPNPFRGLTPENAGTNGATIARSRLLQAYPHFNDLQTEVYDGTNRYNGGYVRLEKRFSKGYMISTSYTYSKFREEVAPLNPWQNTEDRLSPVDRPHRITLATVAELPFGRGRRFGGNWNRIIDAVLGGWQVSGRFEWQTGQPLNWNNVYFDPACGDPASSVTTQWGHNAAGQKYGVDIPIINTTCFYTFNNQPFTVAPTAAQLAANDPAIGRGITYPGASVETPGVPGRIITTNGAAELPRGGASIRTFPSTLPNARFQNHHILDVGLTKNFQISSRVRLQLRAEALNATNYTIFNAGNITGGNLVPTLANFGRITNLDSSTVIRPRDIQVGAKLTF